MFWPAIAFLLGDLFFQLNPGLPSLAYIALLPLFWFMIRLPIPGVVLLAWFSTGYAWGLAYAHMQANDGFNQACLGDTVLVEGTVFGLPQREEQRSRFEFEIDQMWPAECLDPGQSLKIRVNWYQPDQLIQTGERWRLSLKLRKTRNFYNQGGFDYEAALLSKGIRYTAYIRDSPERIRIDSDKYLDPLRQTLAGHISMATPDSSFTGILQALVIGDRSQISIAQWETLRRSGTLHLMAISGLHIGMIAGIGYFLGAGAWRLWPRACLYRPAPDIGAVTAILFALFYSALAGFSLPTQRALIMLGAVMLALILRRKVIPRSTISLALFIVLILDPFSVTQAGFWLSFVAVGLLLLALERKPGDSRITRWSRAQWVLLIGLLPLNLLFFKGTPLVSPLANLMAIPWIGITVLPPSLLGSFLLGLGFESGALLLRLADFCLGLIWPVLETLQALPISWMAMPAPGIGALLLAGFAIILLLAPSGWPGRLLGAFFLLPLFLMQAPRPEPAGFWLEVLDVGEGLAIVIHTREHSLIYDTGPRFSQRFDTGSAVVLPYLYQNQIHQIDTLIISHGDNDHIGGANSLIEGIPVKQLLSSVPEKLPAEAYPCHDGLSWNWDGVDFQILHPMSHWPYEGNNRSCVLRISNDYHSVLLTGDIESISEFRLRKDHAETLDSDILLVPHHGSLTSSTQEFITAVAPNLAIVSSGHLNRFGFPKREVLERYEGKGIPVMNTADYGAIHMVFRANDHPPRVESYLQQHHRYWYSGLEPPS